MRGWAALALVPGLVVATTAPAAEALHLTWRDCALGAGAVTNEQGNCGPADRSALYVAFQPPQTLDGVLGVEIVIDVQHSDPVLPNWWRFDVGGCMESQLLADADFTTEAACEDPWLGNAGAVVQGYLPGEPRGGFNQARIKVVSVVPPESSVQLLGDRVYYAARLVFPGSFTCGGCQGAACLVLNSILVRRLPGQPGGDVLVQTPAAGSGNWATWEEAGADCSAVPVVGHTWGQIKALYR
jgi:hypothetical protein